MSAGPLLPSTLRDLPIGAGNQKGVKRRRHPFDWSGIPATPPPL